MEAPRQKKMREEERRRRKNVGGRRESMCLCLLCCPVFPYDYVTYVILSEKERAIEWMKEQRAKPIFGLLAFMKMELSAMIKLLEVDEDWPSWRLPMLWSDVDWSSWWQELRSASLWVSSIQVDPLSTLLRRAARRCRCSCRTDRQIPARVSDGAASTWKLFQEPYKLHFLRPSSDPRPHHDRDAVEPEAVVIGVDDGPREKLLGWIMATDQKLRVISIVGPAGIGKTTLAMEFRSLPNFRCHAIAQVGRRPDVKKLLQHILSQVQATPSRQLSQTTATRGKEDEQELQRRISERLRDERYFILIDDIWDINDWHKIKDAFPNNERGSRIFVTTCFTSIARSCRHFDWEVLVHEMEPLSKSNSKRLLLTRSFGKGNVLPRNVNLICDEILRRCEGIPLFITGMANWLKKEWQQQEAQMHISTLYSVEQVPNFLKEFEQALSPTYNDLRYESQLLLIYMASIFPQGYLFEKDRLIMKWLSQEGLTPSLDVTGEDEEQAEKCFRELVDRNIIKPVAANQSHNGNPDDEDEACQWKISHYMWQILASMSAEKGFAFTSTSCTLASTTAAPEAGGGNKTQTIRRLAVHHPNAELPSLLKSMDFSQTRCLVMSGAVDQIPLHKFLYLVVLDLEGWENLKDEDMEQICDKMYLLLHLSIRNTRVTRLPVQIQELCSLRTLDVSHTEITELPTQLKGLYNLRTLDVSHTHISELPSEVYMLKNLWRLDLRGTHIHIRQLAQHAQHITKRLGHILADGEMEGRHLSDSVRTLPTIVLREQPASLMSLGDLTHLRVLAITWSFGQCTDKDYRDALVSSIKMWHKLRSLTIDCGFGCCMDFLDSLSDPPQGLEKFKVTAGTFTRVPKWIDMLNSLSSLQITVCKLETDDLQKLGDLPRLHSLVLGLEFIPTEEIVIESEGFCWLFTLSVNCAMPWLTFREGAMRRLECLELKVCSGPANRESAVPSGITKLGSLTEVVLHYNKDWCSSSSSVKKTVEAVKEEVAKHSKQINLIINGTTPTHDVRQIDQNMGVANEIESEEVQGEAQSHAQLSW